MNSTQIIGASVIYGSPVETIHEILFRPVFHVIDTDGESADILSSVKQIYDKFGLDGVIGNAWTSHTLDRYVPREVGYDIMEIVFEVVTEGAGMVNPFDCIYKMGKHPSDYPFRIMSVSVLEIVEETNQVLEIQAYRNHSVGYPNAALRYAPSFIDIEEVNND